MKPDTAAPNAAEAKYNHASKCCLSQSLHILGNPGLGSGVQLLSLIATPTAPRLAGACVNFPRLKSFAP